MKQLLLIFAVSLCLAGSLFGQIETTIFNVQDTTGGPGGGDSKLLDSTVTVVGVISAERWAFNGRYFIQDGSGPWNGVMVYGDWDRENAYGDSVRITADVDEYNGLTELVNVTAYEVLATGATVEPTLVTTGEIGTGGSNAEAYEGVLVQIVDVEITSPDLGYGEWGVDDGSGECMLDDYADYYFTQANYDSVRSITGVLDYSFGNTKIWPRLAWDIVEAGKFTRIQRIQQVRYSDLLKTSEDQMSDVSYAANPDNPNMAGDTLWIKGIVTYPTGLGYAGAGVKMILSQEGGGPWSSILSYHPVASAFPVLFEGDIVEFYGYVGEYRTAPSNMTEFWILADPVVTPFGPEVSPFYVQTGDLRAPETAEQWGNVLVYIKDAKVINTTPAFELFEVDDGTGPVLIDNDSDSLTNYPDPTLGSVADSIRGWVYHHYGAYEDSNTYVLEPLYQWDIVWGVGLPPTLSNVMREPGIPTPSDAVTVSVDIATDLTITTSILYYRVDGGEYSMVDLENTTGDTYTAEIPAQAMGSWVDYFITVTDDEDQNAMVPADTSVQNLCYPVTDGALTINNIQYTPWELADSPFEGVEVEITGMVAVDTLNMNGYDYFPIQDENGAWNGLYVYADGMGLSLNKGDVVSVSGTVTDYNSEWSYMMDNNTQIIAESVEIQSTGETLNSEVVTTGTLNEDSSDVVESYEGVMVEIQNATLVSINSYDASFDDGTGPCLVDDDAKFPDFYVGDGYVYAFGDTLHEGDVVDMIKGTFIFSFGTYKIEIGGRSDMGSVVGIDSDFESVPLTYELKQNFPNPFNPETRIYFQIPQAHDVTIAIYNMLGQKIRTLVKENFNAGSHVVNWDGQSDHGLQVPTGMYIYRIKAGDFVAAKKMVMIK
jgi:hypothetical protein